MLTLLKLIADGAFHSGQVLGDALGISRSAVWKQLQLLETDLGIEIHKVRGRGYKLSTPVSLLDGDALSRLGLPDGWSFHTLDSVDSTNAEAARLISRDCSMPALVLAERQTSGRGRRGRKWVSPFAANMYYSLALRIDGGMRQLEGLSLLIGLAVMTVLRDMGVERAGLKWPNDVLVGRKKIAGILLELIGDPADVCHVIIGVGVNVNMQRSVEVDQSWTSIRLETGALVDRNELAVRMSQKIESYLVEHRQKGFEAFRDEWERGHLWQGSAVTLLSGVEPVNGIVLGIDALGALRLEVDGVEKSFSGGELSLRLRDDS
ncbi:bifunctional biotin--[acetyl-CoA-carboxylase] ligase/biotin operon repressor BirA [Pseudomonas viridiflava]|uniref:bifunctional biotin--[acetyl-CoA-carboxylase] ligase/biotin operon repressor BirA n=1 Tax=Pseudomonas syringae group TaxID=136849 RepID=UPI000F03DCA7|nr:bifunctional biotin--[acetyl-CoA-carboxylase] ligase/biotin operon repressor BirA [Pseudomonas viridiflava]